MSVVLPIGLLQSLTVLYVRINSGSNLSRCSPIAKVELDTLTLRPAVRACYLCPALLVFRIKNCLHTLGSGLHHCQSVILRKEGSSNPAYMPDRDQSTAGRDHLLSSVSEDPSNLRRLNWNSSVYIYIPPPLDEGHLDCSLLLRCILPPPSGPSR